MFFKFIEFYFTIYFAKVKSLVKVGLNLLLLSFYFISVFNGILSIIS